MKFYLKPEDIERDVS